MPNWCTNNIEIEGTSDELDAFWQAVLKDPEGFEITRLVPMPEALLHTPSPAATSPDPNPSWVSHLETGHWTQERFDSQVQHNRERYEAGQRAKAETGWTDWYSWQHDNWGIKWGDCDTQLNRDSDKMISGWYETPWAPLSDDFWERALSNFPGLTIIITFVEEGMGFEGVQAFRGSKLQYFEDREHMGALYANARRQLDEIDESA